MSETLASRLREAFACNCNFKERADVGALPPGFVRHANWCNTQKPEGVIVIEAAAKLEAHEREIAEADKHLADWECADDLEAQTQSLGHLLRGMTERALLAESRAELAEATLVTRTQELDEAQAELLKAVTEGRVHVSTEQQSARLATLVSF